MKISKIIIITILAMSKRYVSERASPADTDTTKSKLIKVSNHSLKALSRLSITR